MDEFDRFVTIVRKLDAETQAIRTKKTKQAIDLQKEEDGQQKPPKTLPKLLASKGS